MCVCVWLCILSRFWGRGTTHKQEKKTQARDGVGVDCLTEALNWAFERSGDDPRKGRGSGGLPIGEWAPERCASPVRRTFPSSSRAPSCRFAARVMDLSWTIIERQAASPSGRGASGEKIMEQKMGRRGRAAGLFHFSSVAFFSLDNSISPTGPNLDAAATLRPR